MAKRKAAKTPKKSGAVPPKEEARKAGIGAKLTEAEEDLLRHMEDGYQLETDSLGGNPVLRNMKDDSVVRPASANRSTVEALEKRGLIAPGKGSEPLKIVWRMKS